MTTIGRMFLEEKEQAVRESRKEGRAEGLAEGRTERRAEGRELVFSIIDRHEQFPKETPEQIAKVLNCDVEEVTAVIHRKKRSWKK